MVAGTLTEIITILKHSVVVSEYGDQNDIYTPSDTTRADVIYRSGNRTDTNNEAFYAYHRTLAVRRYIDVDEFDRIRWKDKIWRILSIDSNRIKNSKTIEIELVNE